MAATDTTQQPEPHTGAKIAAAGAALALVGGPPVAAGAIAPVQVATNSAKAVIDGAVAATQATMGGVSRMIGAAVTGMLDTRYPDANPRLDELETRASAFPDESAARVRAGMRAALQKPSRRMLLQEIDNQLTAEGRKPVPDQWRVERLAKARLRVAATPGPREAAVSTLLNNEKRYAALHAKAQMARAVGLAEQSRLERVSPLGGYWMLGEAKDHTADCVALAGGTYPHSVLRKTFPPLHVGCVCRVISIQEAINRGYITPEGVAPPKDAIRHARRALALHEHDAQGLLFVEELRSRGVNLIEDDPLLFADWTADAPDLLAARIDQLREGKTLRLPDGTAIRRRPDGIQVRRDGNVKRGFSAEDAARNALDRSARSGAPGSIGDRAYRDFAEFLAERAVDSSA